MSELNNTQANVSLGAFQASKALFELFETASPNMTKQQLEFIARAEDFAQLQAENLSSITEALGLLISDDAKDSWDFQSRCPKLLWQLSYQLDAIAGMIELASSARFKLEQMELKAEPDKV